MVLNVNMNGINLLDILFPTEDVIKEIGWYRDNYDTFDKCRAIIKRIGPNDLSFEEDMIVQLRDALQKEVLYGQFDIYLISSEEDPKENPDTTVFIFLYSVGNDQQKI